MEEGLNRGSHGDVNDLAGEEAESCGEQHDLDAMAAAEKESLSSGREVASPSERLGSGDVTSLCQPDEQLRLLSQEVKLQRGDAEGQQSPEWHSLGTGALLMVLSQTDPDASRIVLGNLPPPERPGGDIEVIYSVALGDVQINSASDGVVYLQLSSDPRHYLAFSFKDLSEARIFYEVLGGKRDGDADDLDLADQTYESEEGLDFVAVFAPSQSNLTQFIEHLRKVDDNLFHIYHVGLVSSKYDSQPESIQANARNLINALVRDSWLTQLWDVFDKALETNDEITLAHISELLVRIINVSCRVSASQTATADQIKAMLNLFYVFDDIKDSQSGPDSSHDMEDKILDNWGPPLNLTPSLLSGEWSAFREHAERLNAPNHLSGFLDPLCILMSDQCFERFLRAMERLPNLTSQLLVIPHVDFWKKQICFRGRDILTSCVASEESQHLFAATVSWVSRLTYARDVCLPRCLDDPAVTKFTMLISCANILLCRLLTQDKNSFVRIQQALPHSVRVALFLVQILRGVRSSGTALNEKQNFFQAIAQANVLGSLEGYFTGECPAVTEWQETKKSLMADRQRRSLSPKFNLFESSNHYETLSPLTLATEIMTICASFFPRHIQHAILQSSYQNHNHPKLWLAMTRVLRKSNDQAVLLQIAEIFKLVLHPNVFTNSMEKEDFLGLFFDKGVLSDLIDILVEKCDLRHDEVEVSARLFAKSQIVSIFCQCAHLHQSRIRYRFMQCNLPIKLVNLAVSLFKHTGRYPLGHGVKSLLLHTIKFVKIFSVEQESGTGKDAVAALLPLLLPTDLQDLAAMGAASSDESGDEGFSMRSNDSSHFLEANAWDSDDTSQDRGGPVFSCNRSRDDRHKGPPDRVGSTESVSARSPPALERRHFQGTVIEAALLDLFSSVLKRAQEKKLSQNIRHLVERNASLFRVLSQLYIEQCGITIFSDILQVASVAMMSLPSPTLTAPLKHSTSQRVDPGQAGKTLPAHMGGVRGGLLKRGRATKGAASPSQSAADSTGPDTVESAQKRSRLNSSMDLNRIQSHFASGHTTEFKLPSVAKSKESPESEDALELLLKRGSHHGDRPSPQDVPRSQNSTTSGSGIQINFSQRRNSLDNRKSK